jgi:hypothetical protein
VRHAYSFNALSLATFDGIAKDKMSMGIAAVNEKLGFRGNICGYSGWVALEDGGVSETASLASVEWNEYRDFFCP